jgi:hypothetical protein
MKTSAPTRLARYFATTTCLTALCLTGCGTDVQAPTQDIGRLAEPLQDTTPIPADIPWCYGSDTARNPRLCTPSPTQTPQRGRLDFGDTGRG